MSNTIGDHVEDEVVVRSGIDDDDVDIMNNTTTRDNMTNSEETTTSSNSMTDNSNVNKGGGSSQSSSPPLSDDDNDDVNDVERAMDESGGSDINNSDVSDDEELEVADGPTHPLVRHWSEYTADSTATILTRRESFVASVRAGTVRRVCIQRMQDDCCRTSEFISYILTRSFLFMLISFPTSRQTSYPIPTNVR
jgi:hypothetical protein